MKKSQEPFSVSEKSPTPSGVVEVVETRSKNGAALMTEITLSEETKKSLQVPFFPKYAR